jgi:hypothetical protein
MKNIFLILLVFAAGHVGAGEATVQFRIRGLFDPQRVEDLKRMTAGIADFRIVAVDYDSATATFAYADDKPPFKGAKPESVERGFRERMNGATRGNFSVLPLAPLPRAQWQEVRIGIAGVDCRGCSFGAYNAVAEIYGVLRATSSFRDGQLIAWIDPQKTDRAALEAALKKRNVELKPSDSGK